MINIAITSAKRTPWGSFLGGLKNLSAPELGGHALKAVLPQTNVDAVYMGCVVSAGLGQGPARQATHVAGLPWSVPSVMVNKVCGSGLVSIIMGCQSIALNTASCILAGGMESLSRAPFSSPYLRTGVKIGHTSLQDLLLKDGLEDAYSGKLMGTLADHAAKAFNISRESQESYVTKSFQRYQDHLGTLSKEIIPLGDVTQDEPPLKVKPEKFSALKPSFGGSITAGTASSLADGAAAVCLMSESLVKESDITPLAWILGATTFSGPPEDFATAPIHAMKSLCQRVGWSLQDVDVFEINEAFALVPLIAIQEFGLSPERVNPRGGACIMGHPLGATGTRLVGTMAHHLLPDQKGIVVACIGGGEAIAIALRGA